ncbi:hypothetical protein ACP4OV_003538 [Aristida adscensionis]
MDVSPPPPEPTLSPEPDIPAHDHRSWRAEMMSALGESVSFGRFLAEPLDWARRSAFPHDRYLDDAARHSRPGSVAAKAAFFDAHYATKKRKTHPATDAAAAAAALDAPCGAAAAATSSSTESSCMTDEPPTETEETTGGGGTDKPDAAVCSGGAGLEPTMQAPQELEAVAGAVASSCTVDAAADEACHWNGDAPVAADVQAAHQSQEKQEFNSVDVDDAVEKQPLKEIPIANQDITDSAKKRRLHVSSLLQKPAKPSSSPPSGKKRGQSSSSAKRRSPLHSAKENTSPAGTHRSNQTPTSSVPKKRSALSALHMSMGFTRSEAGSVALIKRNVGTTIAERISQLESASRPVGNTQHEEFRPPTKTFSQALPQTAPKPQVDQQRSSHVMRVKEKLFGSASPSLQQKTSVTKGERKFNNEPGYKESRQSFCFKARPLPNFYRKNKQEKDSSQQTVQETSDLSNSDHHARQASKGVSKEKQMCCFPIRKLY